MLLLLKPILHSPQRNFLRPRRSLLPTIRLIRKLRYRARLSTLLQFLHRPRRVVMRPLFLIVDQLDQSLRHLLLKLGVLHAEASVPVASHQGGAEHGVADALD